MLLKNFFSLNHQFLYWSPESPLKVLSRARTLGRFGDLQGTSPRRRVSTGYELCFWLYLWFLQKNILSQSNRTWYKDKQNNLILKTWLIDPTKRINIHRTKKLTKKITPQYLLLFSMLQFILITPSFKLKSCHANLTTPPNQPISCHLSRSIHPEKNEEVGV